MDSRYRYNAYFISEELKWGYRISDALDDDTYLRNYGFETMQDAEKDAIKTIKQMEKDDLNGSDIQ